MKNILVILFCSLCTGLVAQIGVYTESPSQLLHIDAAKNNNNASPSVSQMTDDVVFTTDGKLGLGVTDPKAKLHINGSLRVNDGTQADGKLLMSSNDEGLATWGSVKINKIANWKLSGSVNVPASGMIQFTGTSTMIDNEIDGLSAGTNSLRIPRGKYIVIVNGDLALVSEYGIFTVKTSVDTPFSFYYSEWLGGATFLLDLTNAKYANPETITIYFTPVSTAVGATNYYYTKPPYTNTFWYTFSIIMI